MYYHNANYHSANHHSANNHSANHHSANCHSANCHSANCHSANYHSANITVRLSQCKLSQCEYHSANCYSANYFIRTHTDTDWPHFNFIIFFVLVKNRANTRSRFGVAEICLFPLCPLCECLLLAGIPSTPALNSTLQHCYMTFKTLVS